MELFSYKSNVAFKQRVKNIHQIGHYDESLHLGHYHEFYIDDERMGYVQKVLLTSGAAFILNAAFHNILDGYIWSYIGLPLFTIVMPRISSIAKHFFSYINPLNLFKKKRRFGLRIPHLFGRSNPHHPPKPHSKPHGHHKPDHKPQMSLGLGDEDVTSMISQSQSDMSGTGRKSILQKAKWGLLSWLVVMIVSPLSFSSMRGTTSKWIPGSIPASIPRQQNQKYFKATNTKTKNKNSDKRNSGGGRSQRGAAVSQGSSKERGNILQSLFARWKNSSWSNKISQELFNGKKPKPGSAICPLRYVVVDAN